MKNISRLIARILIALWGCKKRANGLSVVSQSNSNVSHFLSNNSNILAGRSSPLVKYTTPTLFSKIAFNSFGTLSCFLLQLNNNHSLFPTQGSHSISFFPDHPKTLKSRALRPTRVRAWGILPRFSSHRSIKFLFLSMKHLRCETQHFLYDIDW